MVLVVLFDQGAGRYLDTLYLNNTNDYSNGKLNVFLNQERCDTLFIGSSRVLHTINTDLLGKKSRVLAYQNKNICHNVALFDVTALHHKHPKKTLVFNVDLDDLHRTTNQDMLEKVNNLKFYYYQSECVYDLINRLGFQERIKLLSRLYKHNGSGWKLLSNPLYGNTPKVSKSGFVPLEPTDRDSIRLARSIKEDFQGLQYERKNDLTYEMINALIDKCKELNIELILINTPYYHYPKEWIDMSREFELYCSKRGVRFIDFNILRPDGIDNAKYWYDNMHMNTRGATLFSKFLKIHLY
jgi:hypothetical protein